MIAARNFINFYRYRFSSQLITNKVFISNHLSKKNIGLFSTTS